MARASRRSPVTACRARSTTPPPRKPRSSASKACASRPAATRSSSPTATAAKASRTTASASSSCNAMTIERQIIDAAQRLRRQREPHLIATVLRVQGSAYRRPGARMLLTQFRWIPVSVSGGCVEADIAKKGWWRTQGGEPVVVTYDSSVDTDANDDDIRSAFGLGCDGIVDVMLERAGAPGRL